MMNELKKMVEFLLQEEGPDVKYELCTGREISNHELAYETIAGVLQKCGMDDFRIHIFHDASGAPLAEVHAVPSMHRKPVLHISLTDESGIHVCLAVCSGIEGRETVRTDGKNGMKSEMIGVGIDLAKTEDLSHVWKVSSKRLARWFGREEAARLRSLDQAEAAAYAAELLSKREAAFKSVSAVYRKYREKNGGHPLPVSFMDFTFPEGEEAVPRKMTAEIFRKENLRISVKSMHCGKLAAAAAVCRIKNSLHYTDTGRS